MHRWMKCLTIALALGAFATQATYACTCKKKPHLPKCKKEEKPPKPEEKPKQNITIDIITKNGKVTVQVSGMEAAAPGKAGDESCAVGFSAGRFASFLQPLGPATLHHAFSGKAMAQLEPTGPGEMDFLFNPIAGQEGWVGYVAGDLGLTAGTPLYMTFDLALNGVSAQELTRLLLDEKFVTTSFHADGTPGAHTDINGINACNTSNGCDNSLQGRPKPGGSWSVLTGDKP